MSPFASLAGKFALITGGAQGLGEQIARRFVERGAQIIITDVKVSGGEALAASMRKEGHAVHFMTHDVSDEAAWHRVLQNAASLTDHIHVLVNNAAVMEFAPLHEMDSAFFDRVVGINLRGTFLGCRHILPFMQAAGSGSIINVSSNAGMVAATPGCGAYAASKGGVRLLTKAAARDYAQFNIRVNSVHPGLMDTPPAAEVLANPDTRLWAIGRTPMARPGQPMEVANMIAFLASDEASYVTGAEIAVDGGYLAC